MIQGYMTTADACAIVHPAEFNEQENQEDFGICLTFRGVARQMIVKYITFRVA